MARVPWFKENTKLFHALRLEIGQVYPQLHFSIRNDTVFLSGSFLLSDGHKIVDRFLIEVEFPPKYPKALPFVFEIGGRIPRIADRHMYSTGEACLYLPLEIAEIFPEGSSLLDFLSGPVRSFFVSQSYFELTGKWPFGEWPHGADAVVDYYSPILGIKDKIVVSRFFQIIGKKEIKGHWLCPCGSGKLLRHCHIDVVTKLHRDYYYGIKLMGRRNKKTKSELIMNV